MKDIVLLVLAFIAGLALGWVFFYGLWLTVKKALGSKIPAVWFLISFVVRTVLTLAGFYFIAQGSWQRFVVCLSGFVTARYLVKRSTRTNDEEQIHIGIIKKGGTA